MDKNLIKIKKNILKEQKKELEDKIFEIDWEITKLNRLEKPYVAEVSSYSGGGSMAFATEKAARNKMIEYYNKKYYKNGLNYGVYMYKWNEDLTRTLLEVKPKATKDFYPSEFKKGE